MTYDLELSDTYFLYNAMPEKVEEVMSRLAMVQLENDNPCILIDKILNEMKDEKAVRKFSPSLSDFYHKSGEKVRRFSVPINGNLLLLYVKRGLPFDVLYSVANDIKEDNYQIKIDASSFHHPEFLRVVIFRDEAIERMKKANPDFIKNILKESKEREETEFEEQEKFEKEFK